MFGGGFLYIFLSLVYLQARSVALNLTRQKSDEQRLFETLLEGYDPRARPRIDSRKSVDINVTLTTFAVHLDEDKGTFQGMVSLTMKWYDDYLKWDPADFGGLRGILVDNDVLWKPSASVFNSGSDKTEDIMLQDKRKLLVNYSGRVSWNHYGKIKSLCSFDILLFPFDSQMCEIRVYFDVSIRDSVKVAKAMATPLYPEDSSWNLTSIEAGNGLILGFYPYVRFKFYLTRYPISYIFNFLGPIIALSALTFLTFFIPPDSGERLAVCLTCFVSFSVFIALVADSVPSSATGYPVVATYLIIEMGISLLSMVFSVVVINIDRFKSPVPGWMKRLCGSSIVYVFCIKPLAVKQGKLFDTHSQVYPIDESCNDLDLAAKSDDPETISEKQVPEISSADWHFVARVIDRMFFFVYMLLNFGGFAYIYDNLVNQF